MAANASQTSGSFSTLGFSRLVGTAFASASLATACGVRVRQSSDGGSNYDYEYVSALTASSGSAFSLEIVGNVAWIGLYNGADNAASVRAAFRLRPV